MERGYNYLAKKNNITGEGIVRRWIKAYNEFGDNGLLRSRKSNCYSFQLKLFVVELYLLSEFSYQGLALSQGINNPSLITKWVNDFRIAGPDALKPKKRGRKKTLGAKKSKNNYSESNKEILTNSSIEHLKELEDELLKLRIENAYLKELKKLHLEEKALLKERREFPQPSRRIQIKGYSHNFKLF